jgi:PBP1b-binding outer membrane lipoprotein LpoB
MKRLLIISFLYSLLAACSAKPTLKVDVNPDIDFKQYNTYQFSTKTDVSVDANPIMINRIQTAINTNLLAKGFIKNDESSKTVADITIEVTFNTKEKQNNSSLSIGLGTSRMGGNSSSSIGINKSVPINGSADTVTTIVINMNDKNHAIWHGSDSYEGEGNLTGEETDQAVNTVVTSLLSNFPPTPIDKQ